MIESLSCQPSYISPYVFACTQIITDYFLNNAYDVMLSMLSTKLEFIQLEKLSHLTIQVLVSTLNRLSFSNSCIVNRQGAKKRHSAWRFSMYFQSKVYLQIVQMCTHTHLHTKRKKNSRKSRLVYLFKKTILLFGISEANSTIKYCFLLFLFCFGIYTYIDIFFSTVTFIKKLSISKIWQQLAAAYSKTKEQQKAFR